MLLYVPLAFLAGLGVASWLNLASWTAVLPAGLGTATLLIARRPAQIIAGMALAAATLGLLRADAGRLPPAPGSLSALVAGTEIDGARGVVEDEPVPRARSQQLRVRIDAVRFADGAWQTTAGHAQVTARLTPAIQYGDVLEIRGRFLPPEADALTPGYAAYLRRQNIDAVLSFPGIIPLGEAPPSRLQAALLAIRIWCATAIEAFLPEPQASLVEGILLGRRATIPRDFTEQLNRSGTSHLLAVSGYNVSLVITIVAAALGAGRSRHAWQRWLSVLAASVTLWLFVGLVGASGSVLRAAAMAQLALLGLALDRTATAGGLLLWGSVFLASWQPALLADAGWQLSLLGTAGLIWLSPFLEQRLTAAWQRFWRIPLPGIIAQALAATFAAQVFVLPVLAGAFGSVSLVAPLANVLCLPLIPPIMLGGTLLALAAGTIPVLAPPFAALTWVPTTLLIRLVEWCASLPAAAIPLPPWPPLVVVAYLAGLVVLCSFLAAHSDPEPDRSRSTMSPSTAARAGILPSISPPLSPTPSLAGLPIAPLTAHPAHAAPALSTTSAAVSGTSPGLLGSRLVLVLLITMAISGLAMTAPQAASSDQALTVEVPPVTAGSLALIRGAGGERLLLNGGPATGDATTLLGGQLRPWDRTVDAVLLTDARETHLVGVLRVLERYRVGLLLDATVPAETATYRRVQTTIQQRGIRRQPAEPGSEAAIGRTLIVEFLGEPPPPVLAAPTGPTSPASAPRRPTGPQPIRIRQGNFSLLIPGDLSPAAQRTLLAGTQPLVSTALLVSERAARDPGDPALAAMLRAVEPSVVLVQGPPPATPTPVTRAVGSPVPGTSTPPSSASPTDAPPTSGDARERDGSDSDPLWRSTTLEGGLRLEVLETGYRVMQR